MVPPAFDRAVAFGTYEGTLRSLIHLLKYDRVEPVAQGLAATLAHLTASLLQEVRGDISGGDRKDVLVVPVPLHRSKARERGFNQSELIARALVSACPADVRMTMAAGMLQRKRATESQSTLTPVQRRRNLRGAFFVPAGHAAKLAGRDVLLVDDIYTTGATARTCSQVLRQAGAERVWVATVARAQRDGVARWDAGAIGMTPIYAVPAQTVYTQ